MVSSTVALLVEVPASGSKENATFPRGQLVCGEDGGDGTTSEEAAVEAAEAGERDRKRLEAAIVACCINFRRFLRLMLSESSVRALSSCGHDRAGNKVDCRLLRSQILTVSARG